jgi:hypothetical protein
VSPTGIGVDAEGSEGSEIAGEGAVGRAAGLAGKESGVPADSGRVGMSEATAGSMAAVEGVMSDMLRGDKARCMHAKVDPDRRVTALYTRRTESKPIPIVDVVAENRSETLSMRSWEDSRVGGCCFWFDNGGGRLLLLRRNPKGES